MVEYSKMNVKLTNTQLKTTENYCQKQNRDSFQNELENV